MSAQHQRAIARGFGIDVPLAFAVRQLAPAHLGIAFGPNVDQQIRVNWQGGKPWPIVLHELVTPLGLHFVTVAGTIHITR
jgi:glucose dehydrogenase